MAMAAAQLSSTPIFAFDNSEDILSMLIFGFLNLGEIMLARSQSVSGGGKLQECGLPKSVSC